MAGARPHGARGKVAAQRAAAAAMRTPSSAVAKDIDGAANIDTAAICAMTNGQPGSVCSSPGVTAAAGQLGS